MRPLRVVFDPPGFDDPPDLRHRDEPVLVQALVPEPAIEALDVGVLVRLAWPDERQLHAGFVSPAVEHLAVELRTMIHRDGSEQPADVSQPLQHRFHP